MTQHQRLLAFLVILSVAAILLRGVSRRSRLPYPVVLAAAGVLLGLVPGGSAITVEPDLILLVFVPGLVFHAGLTLELRQLRRVLTPVCLLATAGVALSVGGTAALVHAAIGLPWTDALLLAAILAPTDPIAVVSVLRSLRAPARLTALLEGESLLNDGTGVAVFSALLASVATGAPTSGDVLTRFLGAVLGGTAVGLVLGVAAVLALRAVREAAVEFLITVTLAYGAYLGADLLHVSGIVADVAAALTLLVAGRRLRLHGAELFDFWNVLGFILNALLFLLIGTALPTLRLLGVAGPVALTALILLAVRAAVVHLILAASDPRRRRFSWRWRHLAVWGGLRGALSVALALSVEGHAGVDPSVAVIAYGVVVLSLLVQGGLFRPLVPGGEAGAEAAAQP